MEGISTALTPVEHVARVNAVKRFIADWIKTLTEEEEKAIRADLIDTGLSLDKIGLYFFKKEIDR